MSKNKCPMCNSKAFETNENFTFQYGADDSIDKTLITVNQPTMTCVSVECGFIHTDWRGEDIRTAAIEKYLEELNVRTRKT